MFISKITICNLFAYYGEVSVNFKRVQGKNLYCIYGDNGFGKTSFIQAARLLFLGTGFESEKIPPAIERISPKKLTFNKFIKGDNGISWHGIVNKNAFEDKKENFFVSFEGIMNDKKFYLKRSWSKLYEQQIVEKLEFNYDSQSYINDEAQNKINTILPPNFVEFFFFNGEEIQHISDDLRTRLREKIEEILQITPLEIIIKQAQKLKDELTENEAENKEQKENLRKRRTEKEEVDADIISTQDKIKELDKYIEEKISQIKSTESKLDKLYMDSKNEMGELQAEKNALDENLQNNKKALSETLKSVIFASNKELIQNLQKELNELQNYTQQNDIEALKRLTPEIKEITSSEINLLQYKEQTTQNLKILFAKILDILPKKLEAKISTTHSQLPFDKIETIKEILLRLELNSPQKEIENIKAIKKDLSKIKEQMDELNTDEFTKIKQDELNEELNAFKESKKNKELERETHKDRLKECEAKRAKLSHEIYNLEQNIRTERIENKLQVLQFLSQSIQKYKEKLINTLKQELHDKILEKYTSIIANDNVKELYIGDDFEIRLKDKYGGAVVVENQSSGQKQILAVSIFWALSELSNSRIPLIIDTPLGRMDAKNRTSIIQKYYTKGEQIIILATDTEIAQREYEFAKPNIAGIYQIQNNDERSYATIKEVADISEIL